jgi:CRP-like cAMP-binding protein
VLGKNPIFRALDEDDRARVVAASSIRTYEPREPILVEDQEAHFIYILLSGSARVFHASPAGVQVVVMFCREPSLFGELEILLDVRHIENVSAVSRARVLAIPRDVFLRLLDRQPPVARALLGEVTAKLAMASHNQKALACHTVGMRLATFLVSYCLFEGRAAPDGVFIAAVLTQDDMAEALGVTRRAVSKEVARWQKAGILARRGGHYVVRDLARLTGEAAPHHIGLTYDSDHGLVVVQGSLVTPVPVGRRALFAAPRR